MHLNKQEDISIINHAESQAIIYKHVAYLLLCEVSFFSHQPHHLQGQLQIKILYSSQYPVEKQHSHHVECKRVSCDNKSINPIGALGVNSAGTYAGGVNCDGPGAEGTYGLAGP